jgi:hypothetical protein
MNRYFNPDSDFIFIEVFYQKPHLKNALMKFESGSFIVGLEYIKQEKVPYKIPINDVIPDLNKKQSAA